MNFSPSTEKILCRTEQQVLQLFSLGCSMEEITALLMLSPGTVEKIKEDINKKLEIYSMSEAVHKARILQLI